MYSLFEWQYFFTYVQDGGLEMLMFVSDHVFQYTELRQNMTITISCKYSIHLFITTLLFHISSFTELWVVYMGIPGGHQPDLRPIPPQCSSAEKARAVSSVGGEVDWEASGGGKQF